MELIGNNDVMKQIGISLEAAQKMHKSFPHTMLAGAAGCGKTSTAKHLAKLAGSLFISIACDSIKERFDVALLIKRLDRTGYSNFGNIENENIIRPTIVFIDEIHNLSLAAQEHLGIAMEEWRLPITAKEARILKLEVNKNNPLYWAPQFTLVGATTNDGRLSKPFRDRFKMRFSFAPYSLEESIQIVFSHAKRLEIEVDEHGALEIAKRGRGIPRILVSLLERCRDASIAMYQKRIGREAALVAFFEMGIDASGLTKTDINLLKTLYKVGDPVGLDNLATILNESPKVLSEAIEPYLIQSGLMLRSPKGRTITEEGCKYLADKGYIERESKYERVSLSEDFDRGF
jgi:Holliday junction DNA helicase RuvB